jgi:hypothetical protein
MNTTHVAVEQPVDLFNIVAGFLHASKNLSRSLPGSAIF